MKLFRCDHCGHALYFENVVCEHCGHRLGYVPDANSLVSLEAHDHDGTWLAPHLPGQAFVFCANAEFGACNWLVEVGGHGHRYCRACRHNELIPSMEDAQNLIRWQVIERAKKRLIYSLLRLRLPLATRNQDPLHGLSFRFPNEKLSPAPVLTGHVGGVITIALAEADDAQREYRRTQFNEPYRTLLGHFRHEIGHHYWDILVANTRHHARFRELFGDESKPYDQALQNHYASAAPVDWQANYISSYATSHPWEDFAETWAHYMHLVDTTEMAAAFGVRTMPRGDPNGELTARMDFDPYGSTDIQALVDNWVPLASLINNLNRAVGQHDAYPFVLTRPIIDKLAFIQDIVRHAGSVQWTVPGPARPVPINTPAG
jgi:hypothetical protein